MAGTITVGTISDGTNSGSATDAIKGSLSAWCTLNGTGTISILNSYNISSVTDGGTGDYRFNHSTGNTNYCAVSSCSYDASYGGSETASMIDGYTATQTRVGSRGVFSGSYYDSERIYFMLINK